MFMIKCANCGAHIYNYKGERAGKLKSALAIPVKKCYPKPKQGEKTICPECKENVFNTIPIYNNKFIQKWQKKLPQNL